MASVAFHHINQFRADGKVRLFEAATATPNGEQRRDFIMSMMSLRQSAFL